MRGQSVSACSPAHSRPARRVLIVDDSAHVRRELSTLLPLAGEIEIVGEAADGLEAVRLAEVLRPDAVVLDLQMPVMDGFQAAREIRAQCPGCRLVALTVHGDAASQSRAIRAGVDCFVVKGTAVSALLEAILKKED